jgi:hypothetical protein
VRDACDEQWERGQELAHAFLLDPSPIKDWFGVFDQVYLPESAIEIMSPGDAESDFGANQAARPAVDDGADGSRFTSSEMAEAGARSWG